MFKVQVRREMAIFIQLLFFLPCLVILAPTKQYFDPALTRTSELGIYPGSIGQMYLPAPMIIILNVSVVTNCPSQSAVEYAEPGTSPSISYFQLRSSNIIPRGRSIGQTSID